MREGGRCAPAARTKRPAPVSPDQGAQVCPSHPLQAPCPGKGGVVMRNVTPVDSGTIVKLRLGLSAATKIDASFPSECECHLPPPPQFPSFRMCASVLMALRVMTRPRQRLPRSSTLINIQKASSCCAPQSRLRHGSSAPLLNNADAPDTACPSSHWAAFMLLPKAPPRLPAPQRCKSLRRTHRTPTDHHDIS